MPGRAKPGLMFKHRMSPRSLAGQAGLTAPTKNRKAVRARVQVAIVPKKNFTTALG